jgi:oxysterol-binding protein-related protein 3/6/7
LIDTNYILQSYLVRWVNVKPETTVSWTVQPHKKSINFGIFKHPGHLAGLAPTLPSFNANPLPSPNPDTGEFAKENASAKEAPSTVLEKLTSIGLKQVYWAGKYEADKISQGTYDVSMGEAGNYALVFDNTFSKNISKTATFFLLTYPSKCQSQIQFGAQIHHSSALATPLTSTPSQTSRFSPKLKARAKESTDSLKLASAHHALAAAVPALPEVPILNESSVMVYTGVLQKRRRKRRQGFARRFF